MYLLVSNTASATVLTGDGNADVFVTHTEKGAFLLVNDGTGNLTVARRWIPRLRQGYYASEKTDLDDDGYCDLIVGGHEHEEASTRVYWGAASHKWQCSIIPLTTVNATAPTSNILASGLFCSKEDSTPAYL